MAVRPRVSGTQLNNIVLDSARMEKSVVEFRSMTANVSPSAMPMLANTPATLADRFARSLGVNS